MRRFLLLLLLFCAPWDASAKLKVLTTTANLKSLVQTLGGDHVSVDSVARGTQDPHYIEAKPSYMVKANRADLVISIGMQLEDAWLFHILQGARNPDVLPGRKGFLSVGPLVEPLEVPHEELTRAEGDVHASGNPHVLLDPIRAGKIALKVGEKLASLDSKNAAQYRKNATEFQEKLKNETEKWKARIESSGVKKVIAYHRTLSYFFDRFGIELVEVLEPKPGIPPTSGHILHVIREVREKQVPLILVENYFDDAAARKIRKQIPKLRVETVPVAVGGAKSVTSLEKLYETLIDAIAPQKKEVSSDE